MDTYCHPECERVNSGILSQCLEGVACSTSAEAPRGLQSQQARAAADTWRVYPCAAHVKLGTGGVKVSAWLSCVLLICEDTLTRR